MTFVLGPLPELPAPTDEEKRDWDEWLASRPPLVKAAAEKLPPWFYYDYTKTKQIVTLQAYAEDGTVRVRVVGDRISVPAVSEFDVFGVNPDDLVRRP